MLSSDWGPALAGEVWPKRLLTRERRKCSHHHVMPGWHPARHKDQELQRERIRRLEATHGQTPLVPSLRTGAAVEARPGRPEFECLLRLSRRLGISTGTDPVKVEHELNPMIPAAERGATGTAR